MKLIDRLIDRLVLICIGAFLVFLFLLAHPRVGWVVDYDYQVMKIGSRYYKLESIDWKYYLQNQEKLVHIFKNGTSEVRATSNNAIIRSRGK